MKRSIFIVITTIILLISITFPTNVFAAPISTTTITSVKVENKTIKVKWKKRANITGYQIQVATDKKFKKNAKTKVKSTKTPKTIKCKEDNIKKEIENHCTNNNNHSIKCGNMGRWFNSKDEVDAYWDKVDISYFEQYQNGIITFEEYHKKSPYGYECWSCSYCGNWTGNFKYN